MLDYKLFKIIICGYNLFTCEASVSSTDQLRDITQDASSSQKPTKFQEEQLNALNTKLSKNIFQENLLDNMKTNLQQSKWWNL